MIRNLTRRDPLKPRSQRLKAFIPDRAALLLSLVLIGAVLVPGDRHAAGWLWDFLNGLGFAGFVGLIYLCLQGSARVPLRTHQHCSYIVLLLIIAHAVWLPLSDSILVEYLAFGAPAYMWAGVLSVFLLAFLIVSAQAASRRKVYAGQQGFRNWHKTFSWLAIGAAAYHIIGSAFYLREAAQYALLMLLIAPLLMPGLIHKTGLVRSFSWVGLLILGLGTAIFIAAALNLTRI